MKGTVNINDFMGFLKEHDLVIAPAALLRVDVGALQRKLLGKTMVTYSEIAKAQVWGAITQKRVYQIAIEHSREGEIIMVNDVSKITIGAVRRIARMRGITLEV